MDDAKTVGKKLVEFCRNGMNLDAISSLYSPDIISVEAMESEEIPREIRGIDQVLAKNRTWFENNEIHHTSADGPFPHHDRFAVFFEYETTAKEGPRKGQRSKFEEVAVYTVKDGRIVREEFFYDMG
ncbi:MAG TPA: nuclear transport factor 2 family protein [Thermoanaerobaculia bacterium]|nr:nuclear transport factor 2 family protein [Thermoanaerobaculia bacterium]